MGASNERVELMEIIKKKISLETLISREHSLIPYISDKEVSDDDILVNGNWGKISYDIDLNKVEERYTNLAQYFDRETTEITRVTFKQLVQKYHIFRNIFQNSIFYKKIKKYGVEKWVETLLTYGEKIQCNIYSSLDNIPESEKIIGIHVDNSFETNGGMTMFEFLLRAMGIFIVDRKYIKEDNGVPETMTYVSIIPYMEKMLSFKNDIKCCENTSYNFLGGDDFYEYLKQKQEEAKTEVVFWKKNVFKNEEDEIESPNLTFNLGLNTSCRNVGAYTIYPSNAPKIKKGNYIRKHTALSNIDALRRYRLTKDEFSGAEYSYHYLLNVPMNIRYDEETDTYFGDAIFEIAELKGEEGDDMSNTEKLNKHKVKYIIGAKLSSDAKELVELANINTFISQYDDESNENLISPYFHGVVFEETRNVLTFNYDDIDRYIIEEENKESTCYFADTVDDFEDGFLFMKECQFGKVETDIVNLDDIVIDRGYISMFEMHYKMGEINTLEDMENYSNNIFGL